MASPLKIKVETTTKARKKFLKKLLGKSWADVLAPYALQGVDALSAATPSDTGKTAASWSYEIEEGEGYVEIRWQNSNVNRGINIALILDVGHGTGTGGWVEGRNYIHPAIQPVFDAMAEECWKEVTEK